MEMGAKMPKDTQKPAAIHTKTPAIASDSGGHRDNREAVPPRHGNKITSKLGANSVEVI
jgi:hypothetical protein